MTPSTPRGSVRAALRSTGGAAIRPGPRDHPLGPESKSDAAEAMVALGERLDVLQRTLWAEATGGGTRSLLLVLQGTDTSGKSGTIRAALGAVNPHGVRVKGFGKPTEAERAQHFLWRIRKELPRPGEIGVFDRSHYEDILVPRVHRLLPEDEWQGRYAEIAGFERDLAAAGTTVVKVFLHISPEKQLERLRERLTDRTKWWKYNPGDLDVRTRWDDYHRAYADVFARTSTEDAPWYVVPADRKWYRNWAVASLLVESLEALEPRLPAPDFDVAAELAKLDRLAAS